MNDSAKISTNSSHTAQQVAQKAHEYVDKAAAQADMVEQRVRAACTDAQGRVNMSSEDLKARYGEMNSKVTNYVYEHPLSSIGVAFGAGVLLAALLRR